MMSGSARLCTLTLMVLFALPITASAQQTPHAAPGVQSGFAPDRLARIDRMLQSYVDSNRIGGAVALVLRDGKVVYQKAVGWADREAKRPMTVDAIFRIASQTKAITSVAVLQLVEAGRLSLSDPVSKYIPTFAHSRVASRSDTGIVAVPARRSITIRDLLTHTAGISYGVESQVAAQYAAAGLGPAAGFGWYTADKEEPICVTMERLGTLPFVAQPGERFVYGYNIDILGCVVERASGIPLDQYISTHITAPLKLNDTYFFLPTEKRNRLVVVYASDSGGHAVRAVDGPRGQGNYVDGPRRSFAGGAGIVSTARDYATFLEMIRRGGELGGARILAPHSVDLMTHDPIGSLYGQPGLGFGLGFSTVERYGASGMASTGTFSWGGAYGSSYFVDPREHLVAVFMINQLPNDTDIAGKFQTLLYAALVDSYQAGDAISSSHDSHRSAGHSPSRP